MEKDLIQYIVTYYRELMTDEEIKALKRVTMSDVAKSSLKKLYQVRKNDEIEKLYGFENEEVNFLASLGEERLKERIAKRIFDKYQKSILNNCPKCNQLTRTPNARQCRFCHYDWH